MTLLAAYFVVLLHAAFVLFVILGGLLAVRFRRAIPFHLAAVAWGAWIELSGGICPLTPLENSLRASAGKAGYHGDFLEHYVLAVLYPAQLTRGTQIALGLLVLMVNAVLYATVFRSQSQNKWGQVENRKL